MRRIFIFLLVTVGLISLIIIFYPKSNQGSQLGQVELPEEVEKFLVGKWQWRSTVDPFDKSNKRRAEVEGQKYLAINEDGTFIEWSKEESKEGVWLLNKKKTAVAFIYGQEKNRSGKMAASLLSYEYRHRIKKLDEGELVLGIQGRHGIVEEAYAAIPSEKWEELVKPSR